MNSPLFFTYPYSFLEGSVWRWTLLLGMVVRGRTVFLSKREREFLCGGRLLARNAKLPLTPPHPPPQFLIPLSSLLWPQGPLHSAYFALTNTEATSPTDGTISWTTRLHLIVYTSASSTHQRLPGSVSVQYGVGPQRHMCIIRVRKRDVLAASCAPYCTVHSQSVYTWEVISPAITKRGR